MKTFGELKPGDPIWYVWSTDCGKMLKTEVETVCRDASISTLSLALDRKTDVVMSNDSFSESYKGGSATLYFGTSPGNVAEGLRLKWTSKFDGAMKKVSKLKRFAEKAERAERGWDEQEDLLGAVEEKPVPPEILKKIKARQRFVLPRDSHPRKPEEYKLIRCSKAGFSDGLPRKAFSAPPTGGSYGPEKCVACDGASFWESRKAGCRGNCSWTQFYRSIWEESELDAELSDAVNAALKKFFAVHPDCYLTEDMHVRKWRADDNWFFALK